MAWCSPSGHSVTGALYVSRCTHGPAKLVLPSPVFLRYIYSLKTAGRHTRTHMPTYLLTFNIPAGTSALCCHCWIGDETLTMKLMCWLAALIRGFKTQSSVLESRANTELPRSLRLN